MGGIGHLTSTARGVAPRSLCARKVGSGLLVPRSGTLFWDSTPEKVLGVDGRVFLVAIFGGPDASSLVVRGAPLENKHTCAGK